MFEWNQIIQDTIPGAERRWRARFFALTHIAMFDAINAHRARVRAVSRPRSHAAAARPRRRPRRRRTTCWSRINPAATAAYDAALARQLGDKPSGFVRRGAALGARVAAEVLAWRQNDGWVVSPFPPYSEPLLPGRWQPTPPANPRRPSRTSAGRAAGDGVLDAVPAGAAAVADERPLRHGPERGEGDRQVGQRDADRRADGHRAALGQHRGAPAPGRRRTSSSIWNNIARDVARERRLSLVETARLFVLMNVSIHDALQTTHTSKFIYGVWRPVTAIRQADTDLNPATDPDPTWLTLIPTPPYPSYAGNMATIGASAARALELAFGTNDVAGDGDVEAVGRAAGHRRTLRDGFWRRG